MDTPTRLLVAMILGSIGAGYFMYGRNQKRVVATVTGLALMVFPGLVSNGIVLSLVSIVVLVLPWLVRV
ncbi:MAG: amino acid transport protein [Deltaproteobacteria bacterium]|nr:amino acid transport protein [Deltaproteobacteria bacterium]